MLEDYKRRSAAIILGCVWMVMLAVLSFLPNHDKLLLHTTGHYHRWGHVLAFLTVTLLLVGSVTSLRSRFTLAAIVVSFGYLLEFLEHFIYNNPLERSDIMIDALGVIFGMILVLAHEEVKRIRGTE
ncbi:hypothetical protein [Tunturiibacter gelidiferens]|uniref:hypothetical protein n=1 Tax=Tunturiibacter gelidiferens TaxID=3069689 RepID=UPI003D9B6659